MEAQNCEVLYRFFRTASEYLEGYRRAEPYPETFYPLSIGGTPSHAEAGAVLLAEFPVESTEEPCFETITAVYDDISRCNACSLARTRKNTVAGEGPEELSGISDAVDVMVIGEAPGADEDRLGHPFVGRAGQLLDKMLAAIQLSRTKNCYITNVVKCRPPNNRDPKPEECAGCADFLEAQIRLIKPKMILSTGRVATQHLLQTTDGIGKLRGRFFDYNGIPLMPIYHPSALLRNENLKRPAWEDLKRFRDRLLHVRNGN